MIVDNMKLTGDFGLSQASDPVIAATYVVMVEILGVRKQIPGAGCSRDVCELVNQYGPTPTVNNQLKESHIRIGKGNKSLSPM